jgi:nucleotide-binding universal stress UspA family protein
MPIKRLLVHLEDSPGGRARLTAALDLAAALGAEVQALCLVAEPFMRALVGKHMPTEFVREHVAALEAEADALLAGARAEADGRGVAVVARRDTGPLARLPVLLARQARHADLTLVGPAALDSGGTDEALLAEAAFMDTGRPALVIPAQGTANLPPRRALFAWDGSREAARAASDAVQLLQGSAEESVVLVVNPERRAQFSDRPGSGLVGYLGRHGVKARVQETRHQGRGVAETILNQAQLAGADLLVMGGYGHSRFREMMVGGVTRYVLEHARMPVLFSH